MASTQELFNDQRVLLNEVLQTLKVMKLEHQQLSTTVNTINGRVNMLAGVKTVQDIAGSNNRTVDHGRNADRSRRSEQDPGVFTATTEIPASPSLPVVASSNHNGQQSGSNPSTAKGSPSTSRIILTTYPGQSGIDPLVMNWGHKDATQRGPVVVSRSQSTIRRRNAIGAHGGSYSIYHALAVASKNLDVDHRPDFTNTEPAANIGPFPQWADAKKIVSMDPLGHLAPWLFKDVIASENVDIRPTIAITRAHMKLAELEQSVKAGRLVPDGRICLNEAGELAVTKFAVEPVWYLPGVAERFGIALQREEAAQSKTAKATNLLNKVASPPTSPRMQTPAASSVRGIRSEDYFGCQTSMTREHSPAARVNAQPLAPSACEKDREYFSFPDFERLAERGRRNETAKCKP
ncbi:hypothetical protein MMC16_007668 [Acarospora aff. strigata]|nr:hypothetical protein [Acarospora aff. strigata]